MALSEQSPGPAAPCKRSLFLFVPALFMIAGMIAMMLLALVVVIGLAGGGSHDGFDVEKTALPSYGDPKADLTIAVIDITGVIVRDGSEASSETICDLLEAAARDDQVHAIILNLDTPGGEVTASDEIYAKVLEVRENTGIPVIACMRSICASGGYYVAMGTDHVIAHPCTLTGSIGVIFNTINYKELFDKIGVHSEVYKSGELKDILNGSRARTDKEREVIQILVDEDYERFAGIVAKGRGLENADAIRNHPQVGDARVISGRQAKELNLVDDLGYFKDAVAKAAELASIDGQNYAVVRFGTQQGVLSLLMGAKAEAPSLRSLLPAEYRAMKPGCLYYMMPTLAP